MERLDKYLLNEPMTNDDEKSFICKGCKHELSEKMVMRTPDYCYLCDPNVTVEELLADSTYSKENTKQEFFQEKELLF